MHVSKGSTKILVNMGYGERNCLFTVFVMLKTVKVCHIYSVQHVMLACFGLSN
jgi:hypothetical protein